VKTLALSNGDLAVGPAGHQTVTGSSKVRQDLALALGERLGNDRFHPTWGSVLDEYVGQPIGESTMALIQNEVSRVLAQYIAVRDEYIRQDQVNGTRSRFDTSDVVAEVNSIQASQDFDTIRIRVTLRTLAGTQISVNRTVTY
jgi:phage baseplate assembly protein W